MPTASSSSASVTFLDVQGSVNRLRAAARRLRGTEPNVAAVVLFGSLASGSATPTPSSDADLLVVLHSDDRRVVDRVPDYSRPFEGLGLSAQVFPWTRTELTERLADNDPFAEEILRTGNVLAGSL